MSRLDNLIKEYCPDGVEYKLFSDVCEYVRGLTIELEIYSRQFLLRGKTLNCTDLYTKVQI